MHGTLPNNDHLFITTQLLNTLITAKALIDHPVKWVKGAYKEDDRRCMSQAIGEAAGNRGDASFVNNDLQRRALIAVVESMDDIYGTIEDSSINDDRLITAVAAFNDYPQRRHSEVMDMFTKAIEKTRNRQREYA